MKNYFVIALMGVWFLSGCSTKQPYINNTYYTDYRPFVKNGFFVTESESVSFDYDAVGHMETEMCSGCELISEKENKRTGNVKRKWGKYIKVELDDVMSEFQKRAVEKGSDGAIMLDIKPIVKNIRVDTWNVQALTGYKISGMLIKRR